MRVVEAQHPDGRVAARFWLDDATGLMLRREVLDRSGHLSASMVLSLVSRRIDHDPRARAVHPWIGATALLLSGVQVFLGLQLMPL